MSKNGEESCKRSLGFFCIYLYLFISTITDLTYLKQDKFIIQLSLIFGGSLVLILSLYLSKNIVLRFIVFGLVSAVTCLIDYKYLPFLTGPYTSMYIYKTSIVEKKENTVLNTFYFLFSASLSILGIIKDIQLYKENPEEYNRPELLCIGFVFVIMFSLIITTLQKGSDINIKRKAKNLYILIFIFSIFGVMCSALSGNILLTSKFRYNPLFSGNLPLAPWYFFILVFLYERDEVLVYFSYKVFENISHFLNPTKKLAKYRNYKK